MLDFNSPHLVSMLVSSHQPVIQKILGNNFDYTLQTELLYRRFNNLRTYSSFISRLCVCSLIWIFRLILIGVILLNVLNLLLIVQLCFLVPKIVSCNAATRFNILRTSLELNSWLVFIIFVEEHLLMMILSTRNFLNVGFKVLLFFTLISGPRVTCLSSLTVGSFCAMSSALISIWAWLLRIVRFNALEIQLKLCCRSFLLIAVRSLLFRANYFIVADRVFRNHISTSFYLFNSEVFSVVIPIGWRKARIGRTHNSPSIFDPLQGTKLNLFKS